MSLPNCERCPRSCTFSPGARADCAPAIVPEGGRHWDRPRVAGRGPGRGNTVVVTRPLRLVALERGAGSQVPRDRHMVAAPNRYHGYGERLRE